MSLTVAQCEIILKNRFKTQDVKFISYELKPISEHTEGYSGEHYKLVIKYELSGESCEEILFLKQKSQEQSFQREAAEEVRIYEKEILFYDFFLKEFEKYGYDVNFASKSFYCIPGQTIIMENKIAQNYKLLERKTKFSMNEMQCVLKSLALFHAAGFAYEKDKSKELGRPFTILEDNAELLKEFFFCQYLDKNKVSLQVWESGYKSIYALIDMLPGKNEYYKKELTEMLKNFKQGKIFAEETGLSKCIGHGDLWSNNMLFKFDGDTAVNCCLLDYQILRYFYPAFDVTLAIYCNTNAEFRAEHLDDMIQYYFNTLSEILNNYNCSIHEIMTLEEFYRTMDLVKADCLLQVTFTNTIIGIPKEVLTDIMKDKEKGFETLIFNNTDNVVKAFNASAEFRAEIQENVDDLYSALLAKNESENDAV